MKNSHARFRRALVIGIGALGLFPVLLLAADPETLASTTAEGTAPSGAVDGDRFSTEPARLWRGKADEASWWWRISFPEPRTVGAILQVVGEHQIALCNAPETYVWQASQDNRTWEDLPETSVADGARVPSAP